MNVAGFLKVRNEIIREGNLYRVLEELGRLCDCGVVCDDASSDGTREHLEAWCEAQTQRGKPWVFLPIRREEQNFQNELVVKQRMLQVLHGMARAQPIDWILWQDGDEIFDRVGSETFRAWLEKEGSLADVWAFHYTQLWRSASFARVDTGFDEGAFWKLWRYKASLSFETKDGLHHPQFPVQYLVPAVQACNAGGSLGRARRAPFDILHLGNYGKNLVWKAIQYRNSGALEKASLSRHLHFRDIRTRKVDPAVLPVRMTLRTSEVPPVAYTPAEVALIERMGDLKQRSGLAVVIVPTFNRGYALDRTLQSVLDQTYTNWVCIVLDDGSTDDTPAVMGRWQDKDPRFFYCRYPENRGGVAMNEIGMNLACDFGEFWVRLGSDDFWLAHKLELDVAAFAHGADAVYGPYRDLHETFTGPEIRNPPSEARSALLSRGFAASWANIAVRTSALRQVRDRHGRFCERDIRNMEDWLVNIRLAYLIDFTWRGLVRKDGKLELVVGARSYEELGCTSDHVEHDAVWRIGADGASQKSKQCNLDSVATSRHLDAMAAFKPSRDVHRVPLTRFPRTEPTR